MVVADLSTSNKNAFYELGVRHALRPHTTIVICEDGAKSFPFDVNHVLIRQYHHMGEGIDFGEVERFRADLTKAIKEISTRTRGPRTALSTRSSTALPRRRWPRPCRAWRRRWRRPRRSSSGGAGRRHRLQRVDAAGRRGAGRGRLRDGQGAALAAPQENKGGRRQGSRGGPKKGQADVQERPEDPYVIQRLALVTYKSKTPDAEEALEEARELLATLNPETSNDTETLGLWGAVHKRLWEVTQDREHLDEAVRGYERGFYLRNDYYNGINFAYLLNVRAASSCGAPTPPPPLRRPRSSVPTPSRASSTPAKSAREVLKICETVLQTEKLRTTTSTGCWRRWPKPTSAWATRSARSRNSRKPSLSRRRHG